MRLAIILLLLGLAASVGAQTSADLERYRAAAEYSKANRGVSVLVIKGSKVVFEDYHNLGRADVPNFLASGTKSFCGAMLAAAIDDKLIAGFDERVSETITEWKTDERKSRITYRQLLSLTSGLDSGRIGRVPTYREAIAAPAVSDPGTKFEYGPVPFQVFGEAMRRKLEPKKESVMDYLKRRILDPIGLRVGFWRNGTDGNPLLPQGASLTAREWAKFGLLMKNRGEWNGKRILPKKLVDELSVGSRANPAYGITFWLNADGLSPRGTPNPIRIEPKNERGLKDLSVAAGAGNQRLYIIPSLDLVIVRQGLFGQWSDAEFLKRIIGE